MLELESVRIGKCQNWKVSELESVRIWKCQNWKVSESESVRIGKCQNWKVSKLESVRIEKCQNWKVSESGSVRVRKCQNWKVSSRVFRFFKCGVNDGWVTIVIQTMSLLAHGMYWNYYLSNIWLIYKKSLNSKKKTLPNFETFQFWHFPIRYTFPPAHFLAGRKSNIFFLQILFAA